MRRHKRLNYMQASGSWEKLLTDACYSGRSDMWLFHTCVLSMKMRKHLNVMRVQINGMHACGSNCTIMS